MIYCPNCGSPNFVSNKLDGKRYDEASRLAELVQPFRNRAASALAAGYGVLVKVVDECRNDYACLDCPRKFSDKHVGVVSRG